jgi:uncharacterized protein DUF3617
MRKFVIPAVVALALPAVGLDNLPQLKEGLWSVASQTISNPAGTKIEGAYSICRNHAYDDKARERAKVMKGCTIVSETFEGGKYTLVSHCEVPGMVFDSTGVSKADGDSATHTESHTTYKPAMRGIAETTMIMDQKYVGSCPDGMQPGDRMDKDGKVIHLGTPAK